MRFGKWLCLATAVMMLWGAVALPPAGADGRGSPPNTDSEPNNGFADATMVSPSGSSISFSGTCSDTDVNDYYKIQLACSPPNADKLTVTISCADGIKRLFIYDPLGMEIMLDGDANPYNDHTVSTVAFTPGYYYVRYEVQALTGTSSYTIKFTKSAATFSGQNNTPSTATPVAAFPATLNGGVNDPDEQADWYALPLVHNLTSADVLTFSCQASANLAARVEVYLANLTYVYPFHYEPVDNNDTGLGNKDDGSFGAPVDGKYYLRVLAVKGSGTYTLKLWKTTVENDDWDSSETAMGVSSDPSGHFIQIEDTLGKDIDIEDYFVFPASLGQIINATVWSLEYDSAQDRPQILIELRDSANQSYGTSSGIAKPVGHADGVSPETTTTSYLRVSIMNYQGGAGRYRINITMNMPPTIFEGKWETPFTVNESSYGLLDLTTIFYDPDGDSLACAWDFGTTNFQADALNRSVATASWSSAKEYVVRCRVSDKKGGCAATSVVIRVGNPGTVHRLGGRVVDRSAGLDNARLYLSTSRMTWSGSDGS